MIYMEILVRLAGMLGHDNSVSVYEDHGAQKRPVTLSSGLGRHFRLLATCSLPFALFI